MPNKQISRLLEFINIQMGAEAFLSQSSDDTPNRPPEQQVEQRLVQGNTHVSKFTPVQASAFVRDYEVLTQYRNDPLLGGGTGFSATLFRCKVTDPTRGLTEGELTLSIRSTEFLDDAVRDNKATNQLEIKQLGWAFGQIAEMEAWYRNTLRAPGGLLDGKDFNVTGYSLGGHLAIAFNLLRREEAAQTGVASPVIHTYTFNGAGTGQLLRGRRLTDIIDAFNRIRVDYAGSAEWKALTPADQATLRSVAQSRVDAINAERFRVAGLPGISFAFGASSPAGSQVLLSYQIALLLASEDTEATSNFPLPGGDQYIVTSPQYVEAALRFANMTEVVGMETDGLATSFVSNSGLHYGTRQEVAIEGQPTRRGTIGTDVLTQGFNLLVANPGKNDFGDTHSLVLLVDSLSLMAAMESLAPDLTLEDAKKILAAMSSAKASSLYLTQGKAEGDTLERTLDALRTLVLGPGQTPTPSSLEGNTWHEDALRRPFHENLQALSAAIKTKGLEGSLAARSLAGLTQAELLQAAQNEDGLGYRYALKHLNAFALTGNDALYAPHNQQGALNRYDAATDIGLTDAWLETRSAFLAALTNYNTLNGKVPESTIGGRFEDLTFNHKLGIPDAIRPYYVFGKDGDSTPLRGYAGNDRLFGGDGADTIVTGDGQNRAEGGDGKDNIAGGSGDDTLLGRQGDDVISGGGGNDTISGGRDNDLLRGGFGADTYVIGRNDGTDHIIDFGGFRGGVFDSSEQGDGKGTIVYDGRTLGARGLTLLDPNEPKVFFESATKYRFTGEQGSRGILTITDLGNTGVAIVIDNFKSGELGITLPTVPEILRTDEIGDNQDNILNDLGQALTRLLGLDGDDSLTVSGRLSAAFGGRGRDKIKNGDGDQYLYGDEGDDLLIASEGDDELHGGTDNDALQGGLDSDYLSGDEGDDFLSGGAGADVITGGDGRDIIFGGGNLIGRSFGGVQSGAILDAQGQGWVISHTVDAGTGGTTYFFSGFDVQDQGSAQDEGDTIEGGAGNDLILAGDGADLVLGDEGDDELSGDAGADTLFGGSGKDRMYGDSSSGPGGPFYVVPEYHESDFLDGEEGDDWIAGQGGNDTLNGGDGNDILQGDQEDLDPLYHGDDYIDGGAGDDLIFGQGGADILYGGDGDDQISGDQDTLPGQYHGADFIDGGAGDDIIAGFGGADELYGGDGDDNLQGDYVSLDAAFHGRDLLDGGAGDDGLFGQGGDDLLFGGEGSDNLEGGDGDDELTGGAGNDALTGGTGKDAYVFEAGDGTDTIYEADSGNVIRFGEGISAESITARKEAALGDFLVVSYTGSDAVAIQNGLLRTAGTFEFADGSILSLRELLNRSLADPVSTTGTVSADQAYGGGGGDRIDALAGDDTLIGGAGDDFLQGGDGNDTYSYALGDGSDVILDTAGQDRIVFEFGIAADDLRFQQDGRSLRVQLKTGTAGLTIANALIDDSLKVEGLEFADGTALTFDDMLALAVSVPSLGGVLMGTPGDDTLTGGNQKDIILGLGGDDTLDGAGGDDLLDGGAGDDTYLFSTGDDVIDDADATPGNVDRLVMRAGVSPLTVGVEVNPDGRLVLHPDTVSTDSVTLPNTIHESDAEHLIERVEFSDGTVWNPADLLDRAHLNFIGSARQDSNPGSDVNDYMVGDYGDDVLSGGKRQDLVYGGGGDDVLDGGDGNDGLYGGSGRDTLAGGAGNDLLIDTAGANVFIGGPGLDQIVGNPFEHDAYRFNLGDGYDLINDRATPYAPNRIVFGPGITPDMLTVDGNVLKVGTNGDQIVFSAAGAQDQTVGGSVGEFEFADGRVLHYADLAPPPGALPPSGTPTEDQDALRGSVGPDVIDGLGGNDGIIGQAGDDVLSGGAGDDGIIGGDGADTLDGGSGNDILQGNAGGDTYVFGRGYGTDLVIEDSPNPADVDTVRFGPGIAPADLDIVRDYRNVFVTIKGTADRLQILNWGDGRAHRIERFAFADGTVWSGTEFIDHSRFGYPGALVDGTAGDDVLTGTDRDDILRGNAGDDGIDGGAGADDVYGGPGSDWLAGGDGNDTLDGGTGLDNLDGGAGNDVYVFGRGYGQDVVFEYDAAPGKVDAVALDPAVAVADVALTRDDHNVYLTINGTGDRLTLTDWLLAPETQVEEIRFADGTVWDAAQILARAALLPPPGQTVTGTVGDDFLSAGEGDDTITGNAGNDAIYAYGGNDAVDGGSGDDFIDAGAGADNVVAGIGNDTVYGGDGADLIDGESGNDTVYGEGGNDTLTGGSGNDGLYGGFGADVLDGGAGTDTLQGEGGSDTYRFGRGSGADTVFDADYALADTDTIEVGAAVTPAQLLKSRSLNDLVLTISGTSDRLTVQNWFVGPEYQVERVTFTDGTVWTADAITSSFPPPSPTAGDDLLRETEDPDTVDALAGNDIVFGLGGNDTLRGNTGNDSLYGGTGDDALTGGAGADTLSGDTGNDTLDGGTGDDSLYGGTGNDLYLLRKLDGNDYVSEAGGDAAGFDTVRFVDVTAAQVTLERDDHHLYFHITGGGTIFVTAVLDAPESAIERFEFLGGVNWTLADAIAHSTYLPPPPGFFYGTAGNDTITGSEGPDTIVLYAGDDTADGGLRDDFIQGNEGSDILIGGAGNDTLDGGLALNAYPLEYDTLDGGTGNDTYVMHYGQLAANVVENDPTPGNKDVLRVVDGVNPWDIQLRHYGNDLVVLGKSFNARIVLQDWWLDDAHKIEEIRFDDGTAWDVGRILAQFTTPSDDDNQLTGTAGDDSIDALGGDDEVEGLAGNDTLAGGSGSDHLLGGDGADVLRGGGEYDWLEGGAGDDRLYGEAQGDLLSGGDGDDLLDGGADGDTLNGGAGNDRYAFGRGYGLDSVNETGGAAQGVDEVVFLPGIAPEDVVVTRDAGNLYANIAGTSDRLTLSGWFASSGPSVESFRFADATVWDAATLESRLVVAPATEGNDTVHGREQGDIVDGLGGNDVLWGYGGNDDLTGGAGNDTLHGGRGDDVLRGGSGNDALYGGAGDDVYVFERGTGTEIVADEDGGAGGAGGFDTIRITGGISPGEITVSRVGGEFEIRLTGTSDRLLLQGQTGAESSPIEQVVFDDGTVWTAGDLAGRVAGTTPGDDTIYGTPHADLIPGGDGNDTIRGGEGDDTLSGGPGHDTLYGEWDKDVLYGDDGNDTLDGGDQDDVLSGGSGIDLLVGGRGNDVLDGGAGDDALYGGEGDDTYVFAAGSGNDAVEDAAGSNTVRFGAGITRSDVSFAVVGDDLRIELKTSGDSLRIAGWAVSAAPSVGKFEFQDGTVWDAETVRRLVLDNPYEGAAVNNFRFERGGGDQVVTIDDPYSSAFDQLIVGAGIQTGDLQLHRFANHLHIDLKGTSDRFIFVDWFTGNAHRADAMRFADGTTWDTTAVEQHLDLAGTPGNDVLRGSNSADVIAGGGGADDLIGEDGDDLLMGGDDGSSTGFDPQFRAFSAYGLTVPERATDVLDGGAGNDTLIGSPGRDVLYGGAGDDILDGRGGPDWLIGAEGNDTYLVGPGSGNFDRILETGDVNGQRFGYANRVRFEAGIGPDSLTLKTGAAAQFRDVENAMQGGPYDAGDIVIGYANDGGIPWGGRLYQGMMEAYGEGHSAFDLGPEYGGDIDRILVKDGVTDRIQYYEFADGTVWTHAQLMALLMTTVSGTGDADALAGSAGSDTLLGKDGDDVLDGNDSGDELFGDAGNDLLRGGAGSDYLWGGSGDDALEGGDHGDYLFGGAGQDSLHGGAGNDWLQGEAGDDVLDGGAGADRIDGGDGDDAIGGGDGDDTIQGDTWHTRVDQQGFTQYFSPGGDDLIDGGAGNDVLYGLDGNDALMGGTGDDALFGGAGNDFLDGGTGADLMLGGSDDDTYVIDDAGDRVIESAYNGFQEGTDLVFSSIDYTLPANVENLTLTGTDPLLGTGNALNNVIRGNDGANVLAGLAGNDLIDGGAGADTMAGGAGDDTFVADDAADRVLETFGEGTDSVLSSVTYRLPDAVENLTLTGGAAIDGTGNALDNVIVGNGAENALHGGDGDDRLVGGAGNDTLDGGAGSDVYEINLGDGVDRIVDSPDDPGVDVIRFGPGITAADLTLDLGSLLIHVGTSGQAIHVENFDPQDAGRPGLIELFQFADGTQRTFDQVLAQGFDIAGTDGNDYLTGTNLTDRISGLGGDDTLDGGAGDDVLQGGEGADRYLFAPGSGRDRIFDAGGSSDGPDEIVFAGGVNPGDVSVSRTGSDLLLGVGSSGDSIVVEQFFNPDNRIEGIVFSGGTTWSADYVATLTQAENHAPVSAAPVADQSADEDAPFARVIPEGSFIDADAGDTLAYTATRADGSALPAWLAFDPATRTFSGTPANGDVGTFSITVTATDTGGLSASDVFDLTVTNVNDAPTAGTAIGPQSALEDAVFSFTVPPGAFSDVDVGDTLTLAAALAGGSPLPSWLTYNAGTFTGTPLNADVGTLHMQVTATDTAGASVQQMFDLTVINANDAPTLAEDVGDQTATEDAAFSFQLPAGMFADVDVNDTMTLAATLASGEPLPDWLVFDASTRTFSGAPSNPDVGTLVLKVTATDAAGAAAPDTFNLVVANVNDAPTLAAPIADQSVLEDSAFFYQLPAGTFADVDAGDSLNLSATRADGSPLPAWLAFDAATRTFAGTPANADVGNLSLRVTATDKAGETVSDTFVLAVINTNDAPTLQSPLADQTANAGTGFSFQVAPGTFADVDVGDTLTYTASLAAGGALPTWLAFDAASLTFTGTPLGGDAGTIQIRVTATDHGGLAASDDFALTVQGASGVTLIGTPAGETLTGGAGDDTLDGAAGADLLNGSGGNDLLRYAVDSKWNSGFVAQNVGSPGNPGTNATAQITGKNRSHDVFFGGAGEDTIEGTAGDDALFLDDTFSLFLGNVKRARLEGIERVNAGDGNDVVDLTSTVYTYGNITLDGGNGNDVLWASAGADSLFGGAGNDDLFGGAGDDYLSGGDGNDALNGDRGNDLLQGGAGNDTLKDTSGNNLLQGGAGNDSLTGGTGNELFIGGAGNDTLTLGKGRDVIAFNRGDGADSVGAVSGQTAALSLGGGIAYEDMFLRKDGNNLVVEAGPGDRITFANWYSGTGNRGVGKLQVIAEAMAGFDANPADTLRDDRIETFDFQKLVQSFDTARAASPTVNRWAMTHALLDAHLAGSDTEALGGDLAYRYGLAGTLAGIGTGPAQAVLGDPRFGSGAQSLQPLSALQEGLVKLG